MLGALVTGNIRGFISGKLRALAARARHGGKLGSMIAYREWTVMLLVCPRTWVQEGLTCNKCPPYSATTSDWARRAGQLLQMMRVCTNRLELPEAAALPERAPFFIVMSSAS